MANKAKSAANDPNWAEIPSKRSFWRGSGEPGQEAEHLHGQEAKNCHQGQICSKWAKLGRNPIGKATLDALLGHLAKWLKMATKAKSAANGPN